MFGLGPVISLKILCIVYVHESIFNDSFICSVSKVIKRHYCSTIHVERSTLPENILISTVFVKSKAQKHFGITFLLVLLKSP